MRICDSPRRRIEEENEEKAMKKQEKEKKKKNITWICAYGQGVLDGRRFVVDENGWGIYLCIFFFGESYKKTFPLNLWSWFLQCLDIQFNQILVSRLSRLLHTSK